jgi:hypothetical protein
MSGSFSFVPRPHSIAHCVAISISAENRLTLVEASMECGAIMPLGQRLRIGLVNCMAGSEESNHLFGALDTTKAHRLGNGARDQPSQLSRLMKASVGASKFS